MSLLQSTDWLMLNHVKLTSFMFFPVFDSRSAMHDVAKASLSLPSGIVLGQACQTVVHIHSVLRKCVFKKANLQVPDSCLIHTCSCCTAAVAKIHRLLGRGSSSNCLRHKRCQCALIAARPMQGVHLFVACCTSMLASPPAIPFPLKKSTLGEMD